MRVISLGGSLVVPDAIDTDFLRRFATLVRELLADGQRYVIVVGGGKTARRYQEAVREVRELPDDDLDWLGIHATRLNAHLLRTLFREEAAERVVTNPVEDELPDVRLLIAAGWRPGCSTDYDAALLAHRLGASSIVNLSNVSHVYSDDPRSNPDATRYDRMTWDELLAITGETWSPGKNVPFDPLAAKECRTHGIDAAILSATDMENVRLALTGGAFTGTRITR